MVGRKVFVKKISLLAALLLIFGSMVAVGMSSVPPEQFSFTEVEGGVVITGYRGAATERLVLPSTLGGKPVVAIGSGAFWGNEQLTAVELPATVTTVESNAFTDCSRLAELVAPSVVAIGDYAFYGCARLTEVTVGSALASVGNEAFGSTVPSFSVTREAGVEGLVATQAVLQKYFPTMATMSIEGVPMTENRLAIYSRVADLMKLDPAKVDKLWADDIGFLELYAELRSTGIYSILTDEQRAQVDRCLDSMIADLAADAKRLAATK